MKLHEQTIIDYSDKYNLSLNIIKFLVLIAENQSELEILLKEAKEAKESGIKIIKKYNNKAIKKEKRAHIVVEKKKQLLPDKFDNFDINDEMIDQKWQNMVID